MSRHVAKMDNKVRSSKVRRNLTARRDADVGRAGVRRRWLQRVRVVLLSKGKNIRRKTGWFTWVDGEVKRKAGGVSSR